MRRSTPVSGSKTSSLHIVDDYGNKPVTLKSFRYKRGDNESLISAFKKAESVVCGLFGVEETEAFLIGWHGVFFGSSLLPRYILRPVFCVPADAEGKWWVYIPSEALFYHEQGGFVFKENGGVKYFTGVWDAYLTFKEMADGESFHDIQGAFAKYVLDKISPA